MDNSKHRHISSRPQRREVKDLDRIHFAHPDSTSHSILQAIDSSQPDFTRVINSRGSELYVGHHFPFIEIDNLLRVKEPREMFLTYHLISRKLRYTVYQAVDSCRARDQQLFRTF